MSAPRSERIVEVNKDDLEKALTEARAALSEKDYEVLKNVASAYAYLTELVGDKDTTIRHLRRLLFGSKSEKTSEVLKDKGEEESGENHETGDPGGDKGPEDSGEKKGGNENGVEEEKKRKGHGRNGADDYTGAEQIEVRHESLKPGDPCPQPECKGRVYLFEAKLIVRLYGETPIQGTVYRIERLRCNLCLMVFTAEIPEGIGEEKYTETAVAMMAYLRYGAGFPLNRLDKLQGHAGIPLPAATQWEVVANRVSDLEAAYEELERQAAQGEVVYNDDTRMRILEFMGKRRESNPPSEDPERTGLFTSGVVSEFEGHKISLFFTGRKHAGENLDGHNFRVFGNLRKFR